MANQRKRTASRLPTQLATPYLILPKMLDPREDEENTPPPDSCQGGEGPRVDGLLGYT